MPAWLCCVVADSRPGWCQQPWGALHAGAYVRLRLDALPSASVHLASLCSFPCAADNGLVVPGFWTTYGQAFDPPQGRVHWCACCAAPGECCLCMALTRRAMHCPAQSCSRLGLPTPSNHTHCSVCILTTGPDHFALSTPPLLFAGLALRWHSSGWVSEWETYKGGQPAMHVSPSVACA